MVIIQQKLLQLGRDNDLTFGCMLNRSNVRSVSSLTSRSVNGGALYLSEGVILSLSIFGDIDPTGGRLFEGNGAASVNFGGGLGGDTGSRLESIEGEVDVRGVSKVPVAIRLEKGDRL